MAYLPSDSKDDNISDSDDEYAPTRPTSKDAPASDNENISISESEDDEPLSSLVAKGKKKYKWTRVEEVWRENMIVVWSLECRIVSIWILGELLIKFGHRENKNWLNWNCIANDDVIRLAKKENKMA
ncbi:hypothetical protein FQA39_LY07542 [Lamprigera yunnana]|nr:hypothetical protein FQA39_LY07542 [Lamprigera yunnana]